MNTRGVARAVALVVVAALAGLAWGWWQAQQQRARGAVLFAGEVPLAARLFGHEGTLPAMATRCRNCHEAPAVPGGPAGAGPYAGALTGASLTTARARRGGPPSRFDADTLCALLRTGTDPAHVMIATTMPRYEIADAQCRDLWAYLQTR